MSQREIDRLSIMSGELSSTEGIVTIDQSTVRMKSRVIEEGSKGVIHRLRESNRGYPQSLKDKVLGLYKQQYNDQIL
jgi:hypothetical protein